MPSVFNEYTGDGVTRTFNFSMTGGYLSRDFVVFLTRPNDSLLEYTPYTGTVVWVSDFTVEISEPIPVGTTFVITRKTTPEAMIDFQTTSRLTEHNLDTAFNQSLHRTVELDDITERRMIAQDQLSEEANEAAQTAAQAALEAAQAAETSAALVGAANSAAAAAVVSAQASAASAVNAETVANEAMDLVQQAVSGSVVSFNGRVGVVSPEAGDYTPGMVGFIQSGTVGSNYEFSTIPAWSDAFLNGQARALSNRTQYLRSNQKCTPMMYDTRAKAASAVTASMQTGQLVLVKSDESYGNRSTHNVVSGTGTLDYTGLAYDAKSTYLVHPGTNAVPTDVQTKLSAIVTPEDFGAKGDFVNNDYYAIQRALNYLNSIGGGTLYARNKYSVSAQLHIYSNTTIDMCGTGYIRRDFNTSGTGAGLLGSYRSSGGAVNVTIMNGTLDGNGQNYPQAHNILSLLGGATVIVDKVKFLNVVDFHAIDGGDCKRMTIRSCEFRGFYAPTPARRYSEAIQTDAGVEGLIEDWVIDGCYFGANPLNSDPNFGAWPVSLGNHAGTANAVVRRVVISNNTFDSLTYAGIRPFVWEDVVIKGNHFKDCAVSVLISKSDSYSRVCTNVVISNNTFSGGGANCILVEDNGSYTLPADGLVITGNTFTNVQVAMRLRCVRSFTVSGNKCDSATSFVNLAGCSNGVVSSNTISGGTATTAVYMGVAPSKSVVVSNNTFNPVVGYRAVHINIAAEHITVSGNLIVDCSGNAAIAADSGAKNVSVQNNTIVTGDLGLVPVASAIAISGAVVNPVVTDNLIGAGVPNPSVYSLSGGIFKGHCIGSPEGVINAPVGSLVLRKDGGAGTTMYIKESGNTNTGWVAK